MREASARVLFLLGLVAVVLVAGISVVVIERAGLGDDDDPTVERDDAGAASTTLTPDQPVVEVVLAPDQVSVSGVATVVVADGARLEGATELVLPTVTTPSAGLGSGARFEDLLVDGAPATISWDAGRPLAMAGSTPLRLVPGRVNVRADAAGVATGLLDSAAYAIVPGDYEIDAPVALTRSGLGQARDSVVFTATEASSVAFTGSAASTVPPVATTVTGPGRVVLEGSLELARPGGTVTPVARVELPEGSFRITITPTADGTGYELAEALLEGAVVTA